MLYFLKVQQTKVCNDGDGRQHKASLALNIMNNYLLLLAVADTVFLRQIVHSLNVIWYFR